MESWIHEILSKWSHFLKPMKVSGVFLCQSGGWRIVSSILYKAFSEDEDLRSLKSFKKEEFPDFFSLVSEFFMKSGNFYSWIYWDQEAPVGALLAIPLIGGPLQFIFCTLFVNFGS